MDGASPTLIPLTGKPISHRRSTTPLPRPILSTKISSGRSSAKFSNRFHSFITNPQVCIKSLFCHTINGSITEFDLRLHSAVLSEPNLATSNPQMTGRVGLGSTSLATALSIQLNGMTVSSSSNGNSPSTLTLYTLLSVPYLSAISLTKFGSTNFASSHPTLNVVHLALSE